MADKKDKSLNTGNKNADAISNSATYLEKIPFVGGFFKAARHNREGDGPGTNDMQAPASKLRGGSNESFIGRYIRENKKIKTSVRK